MKKNISAYIIILCLIITSSVVYANDGEIIIYHDNDITLGTVNAPFSYNIEYIASFKTESTQDELYINSYLYFNSVRKAQFIENVDNDDYIKQSGKYTPNTGFNTPGKWLFVSDYEVKRAGSSGVLERHTEQNETLYWGSN
ncbi:hypothetical protein VQL36_20420 [Chengkuizengella sp. SCS-71B]|uniref:hypothetical protein n=1 Tax=Chengkuizengella sp. SCS-71B TaxID=3115290 RepID=UPI0032C22439